MSNLSTMQISVDAKPMTLSNINRVLPGRRMRFLNRNMDVDKHNDEDLVETQHRKILCRMIALLSIACLLSYFVYSLGYPSQQLPEQETILRQPTQNVQIQEHDIAKLPTSVLTEVFDMSIYFSWKMETLERDDDGHHISFDADEYRGKLKIPSFLVTDVGEDNENENAMASILSSSSTSLLRYVAMRGELYPMTTTYEYFDDDDEEDDAFDMDAHTTDRMLQALYVDEMLEKMKVLENHFCEEQQALQQHSSLRKKQETILVQNAKKEIKKYLELSERILRGHHIDSIFADSRRLNIADLLVYSLARRVFAFDKTSSRTIVRDIPSALIPSLEGAFDLKEYPEIEKTLSSVGDDRMVAEFFDQHFILL